MRTRHRLAFVGAIAAVAIAATAGAQRPPAAFKLGTFERQGVALVGVVVNESRVVDLAQADAAIADPPSRVRPPADMKDLIARYDQGIRDRILQILAHLESTGANRPPYVTDLAVLRTLPPVVYPATMLNMAVNYREHALEMGGADAPGGPGAAPPGTRSAPGIWERAEGDARWNPYMFAKLPAAVVAAGEAIRLPPGRLQIDWECELGVVIGRQATRVPVSRARDHVFGYTLELDVSDRGGRGDTRHGSDWVVAKSHDTFAPLGPFIVPKEFIADPQALKVTFRLNGTVMQDANTSLMIHSVDEQVAYASHLVTLRAGDVIATGSPAGVGSARTPPIFLKDGDVTECAYEGVGTLRNTVRGS
jgi:2,4-didehydro-3-deoxy-L-rhamnonate hydrolase